MQEFLIVDWIGFVSRFFLSILGSINIDENRRQLLHHAKLFIKTGQVSMARATVYVYELHPRDKT